MGAPSRAAPAWWRRATVRTVGGFAGSGPHLRAAVLGRLPFPWFVLRELGPQRLHLLRARQPLALGTYDGPPHLVPRTPDASLEPLAQPPRHHDRRQRLGRRRAYWLQRLSHLVPLPLWMIRCRE